MSALCHCNPCIHNRRIHNHQTDVSVIFCNNLWQCMPLALYDKHLWRRLTTKDLGKLFTRMTHTNDPEMIIHVTQRQRKTQQNCMHNITVLLHERHGISNHRDVDCLFNRLFRVTIKNYQSSALLALWGESTGKAESVYKSWSHHVSRDSRDFHPTHAIITSRRRFDVIMTLLLRHVSVGKDQDVPGSDWRCP